MGTCSTEIGRKLLIRALQGEEGFERLEVTDAHAMGEHDLFLVFFRDPDLPEGHNGTLEIVWDCKSVRFKRAADT